MNLKVSISNSEDIPAFAAFLSPSAKQGNIKILINIKSSILACAEEKELDFYELISDSTVHELLHAFQELYKKAFDEDQVKDAIEQGRKFLEDEQASQTCV